MGPGPWGHRMLKEPELGSAARLATGPTQAHELEGLAEPNPGLGRPALSSTLPTVIHSGDYFLFESDSEEEEEAQPEEPRPSAQSAFQVRGEVPCLLSPGQGVPGPRQHRGDGCSQGLGHWPSPMQSSRVRHNSCLCGHRSWQPCACAYLLLRSQL